MTPKFLGVNANSFKMVKATDFKFDRHLTWSADAIPYRAV